MRYSLRKTLIASAVLATLYGLTACQSVEQERVNKYSQSKDKVALEEKVKRDKEAEILLAAEQDAAKQSVSTQYKSEPIIVTGGRHYNQVSMSRVAAQPLLISPAEHELAGENYHHFEDSGILLSKDNPVSTFSIDVDTASYTNVRRMLNDGYLPPKDAVRLEEFINYFDYDFPVSEKHQQPFSVSSEVMPAPWNSQAYLLQVGIKGFEPEPQELPATNLVFLVDVSGSMNSPDKLGLVKKSLKMLAKQMTTQDKVSLVVYAGASGVVLEPTSGEDRQKIEQAIEQLRSGGSTNGAAGIELAYQMAEKGFIKDGVNRVIIATDGDFNVGLTDHHQLMNLIESKRKTGVFFSSLGFGRGNYNDHLMEQLADKGNGNAAYIDSLQEAKKVLVDQRAGTLMTIAKDVKIQLEFNPQVIGEYRLLGYENRALKREDFNNDKVDAGEIGAGHSITALYEVVLTGSQAQRVDPLRYSSNLSEQQQTRALLAEAATLKLRYKLPQQDTSRLLKKVIAASDFGKQSYLSDNIRYAASAAGFAQLLRGGKYLQQWSWQQAIDEAQASKGDDDNGYRSEMIQLMKMAQLLEQQTTPKPQLKESLGADVSRKVGMQ